MANNKTKYVINVDFLTASRVHLNPYYFGEMWCRLNMKKKREHGGKVYVTREARQYLNGERTLLFNGKTVRNLVECINCSKRGSQSVHWDI